MSKDDLAKLCKELYDQGCNVFGEKFDEENQVKKRDMEIHNLEMETSESHGTFKIPKLKKVNKFKMMEGEEEEKKSRVLRFHQMVLATSKAQATHLIFKINFIF